RHADVSLFRARRAELDVHARSLRLTHNFRSDEALLHVVNHVFSARLAAYAPLLAGGSPQDEDGADREPAVELLLTDVAGWEEHARLADRVAAGLPRTQLWRQAEARL